MMLLFECGSNCWLWSLSRELLFEIFAWLPVCVLYHAGIAVLPSECARVTDIAVRKKTDDDYYYCESDSCTDDGGGDSD